MPTGEPATRHAALPTDTARRRGGTHPGVIELASQYGRYGYRRITAMLQQAGWRVAKIGSNASGVVEGLKVPQKQKPQRTVMAQRWIVCAAQAAAPEPCVELTISSKRTDPRWQNPVRLLNLIDEYTRECLMIRAPAAMEQCEGHREHSPM